MKYRIKVEQNSTKDDQEQLKDKQKRLREEQTKLNDDQNSCRTSRIGWRKSRKSCRTRRIGCRQCCGSGMFIPGSRIRLFPSRILDPSCLHPGSRIPDPGSSSRTPKQKKWFLSSKKYDPGCSSRIPDPGS
jgi:hypothetical protein